MSETLKIIVPMAGLGTRLRPHTWNKPKPLLSIAGRTVLDFFLDTFKSIPLTRQVEYVFIIGQMGDQIKEYINQRYPEMPAHYIVQSEMRGQSDAIYLAKEYLTGPVIIAFADTLVDTDFTLLASKGAESVVWVKPVDDPRRFGVAEIDPSGLVKQLIEKPPDMKNNLAIVGIYYFKDSQKLCKAIEDQVKRNINLRGEYYLADAVNILLKQGIKMHAQPVDVWLDAGTTDAMLSTNQYLLEHGNDNAVDYPIRDGTSILPPVFIDPSVKITRSVIGPNVSIGSGCLIDSSIIQNAIIEDGTEVKTVVIENSILGHNVRVTGHPRKLNIGDQTHIEL